jgi:hypothetical protein
MAEGDQAGVSLAAEAAKAPENGKPVETGNQTQTGDLVVKLSDLKEEERTKLARFKTGNDLGKSYLSLESKLGASITLPGKDATEEEKAAFYKRLGRPESKDGYELDTLFLADKVTKDSETEDRIRSMAFHLNLNQEGAKKLHRTFVDLANRGAKMVSEMKQRASESLRKQWGGDYDRNVALVGTLLRKFGDAETVEYMNSGPGNDPPMLRMLAKFASAISPDRLETGSLPAAAQEDDGTEAFPNSPSMTGANRERRIR